MKFAAGFLFITFSACAVSVFSQDKAKKEKQKEEEQDFQNKFVKAEEYLIDDNYTHALPLYLLLNAKEPENANINWKIGVCYLNSHYEKSKAVSFLEKAVKNVSGSYQEDDYTEKAAPAFAYYDLAKAYHLNYQFDMAITNFNVFRNFVHNKEQKILTQIDREIEMCNNGNELTSQPVNVNIKNMGMAVNTEFPEYSPLISADESTLIFTSRRKNSTGKLIEDDGQYYEDIYISYKKDGKWTSPQPIDTNINTFGHEATIGLSVDAQQLLIYRDDTGNGNIYLSKLAGEKWSKPEKLGSDINTKSWETHATLSGDGNVLYFVSDRPGGFGGRDIYRCIKFPNGEWSRAQNLGADINTVYDEDSPFMHPDGIQLLFSSKGHKSMGGFDIFSTDRNDDGTWTPPQNIGYPVNTTDDDIFYITSADGKRAYYSSVKPDGFGEKDLYIIDMPEAAEKALTVLTGTIKYFDGRIPDFSEIFVSDSGADELIGTYSPNSATGKYLFILPHGRTYKVSYQVDGEEVHTEIIDVPFGSSYNLINKPVTLGGIILGKEGKKLSEEEAKLSEEVLKKLDVLINSITEPKYATNKSKLLPESKQPLEKLYELMQKHPILKLEVFGYTDSQGSDEFNLNLSQRRAQAVADFLIRRGLDNHRVIAKGFGESLPIGDNNTPEGRNLNRRIELKF